MLLCNTAFFPPSHCNKINLSRSTAPTLHTVIGQDTVCTKIIFFAGKWKLEWRMGFRTTRCHQLSLYLQVYLQINLPLTRRPSLLWALRPCLGQSPISLLVLPVEEVEGEGEGEGEVVAGELNLPGL